MKKAPELEDGEAWRVVLTDYYLQNAPEKVKLVTDAMMTKWRGKYDELYANMQSKYGPPGKPPTPSTVASKVPATTVTDKENTSYTIPAPNDTEAWRTRFIEYYTQNAPSKVKMVNDAMLTKWKGKYPELYANLESKYGPLGDPQAPPEAAKPKGNAPGDKKTIGDWKEDFIQLVAKADTHRSGPVARAGSVVDLKSDSTANGLETSTFTVCARIRPLLEHDGAGGGGENFKSVVPGPIHDKQGKAGLDHTEEAILLTPKLSLTGKPTLDSSSSKFDYVFGPEDLNEDVYRAVGVPLVARAKAGQVGVVFAYGQTGSGKTHTMNGLMDGIMGELFSEAEGEQGARVVRFSYFEVLGAALRDCLVAAQPSGGLQIGEGLDGRVITKNLSVHACTSAADLEKLVQVAKARRATASTARNDESSRSHGVAILRVGQPGGGLGGDLSANEFSPSEGVLYVIDLAGSERAADSKGHSKERMDETKQINLSLMALKECIRARTMASAPGAALTTHVPYRRSKLTLLLKDVFESGCARMCATVVVAAVSPLAKDVSHSANTLKYAAPLRVAAKAPPGNLEKDPRDPALWTHEEMRAWLSDACAHGTQGNKAKAIAALPSALLAAQQKEAEQSGPEVTAEVDAGRVLTPQMTGMQFCAMPEPELFRRIQDQVPGERGGRLAKRVHAALWEKIVDAKSRKRRADGRLVSEEEEAREQEAREQEQQAKYDMWAEREKNMKAGF